MTCGLGLGILVVFLVQAELVCCLWTQGAQSFQNSNTYAGIPPPEGSLIKSGSYPQNQVRQDFISPSSVQSRSFNTGPAVTSGSGPGLSPRSSTQVVSQPAQSSVKLVKSSSVFKANRQRPFSPRAAAPKGARQSFGLSTTIADGTSVSQNQKNPSDLIMRSWPVKQGMQRSSSSQSLKASRESYSFRPVSPQSAAQAPSKTAVKMSSNSKIGSSAVLFGPSAPGPPGHSVQRQTYARGSAKRVSSSRRSERLKARRLSPHKQAWKPSMGQGRSRPNSWLQTYKTSSDMAVPRTSTVVAPGQRFASATVYEIPANFGGFAIRRLTSPADHNQVTAQKQTLHIPTADSQWMVPSTPYSQKIHPEARWTRIKLR